MTFSEDYSKIIGGTCQVYDSLGKIIKTELFVDSKYPKYNDFDFTQLGYVFSKTEDSVCE